MMVIIPLIAMPAAAQETGGVERTAGGVQIDFQGADMRVVVAALAEAAGLNLVYADLPSRPVTLRTGAPVPVERLRVYLESLLRAHDLRLQEEEGGLLRVVGSGEAAAGPSVPGGTMGPVQPGGPVRVFVHPLRHAPADDLARSIGALYGISDGGGGFRGREERPTSLTQELRGQRYNDTAVPEGSDPSAVRDGMDAMLEGPVQIVPDMRTNSLLIRATEADYATLSEAINQLDTRPLQVLIEVLVAEVRRDRTLNTGVSVRVANQLDRESGVIIGGELAGTTNGDVVLRVLQLGAVRADVVLSALSSSGQVTVLSRPVVMAQNNEEARILVGTERPFIQISRSLPTDGGARDQVVQYREVGTQLTIRPTINPDGYVTLAVLQEVSSATPETQFGAPVISTREAETRLLVKDGHTVVIGGLVDTQRSRGSSGIPYLREIPGIGRLFGSHSMRTDVTELFLFMIPHVLKTDDDVDAATQLVRDRAERLNRALPDSLPLFWRPQGDTIYLLPDTLTPPASAATPATAQPTPPPVPASTPDIAFVPAPHGTSDRVSRRGRRGKGRGRRDRTRRSASYRRLASPLSRAVCGGEAGRGGCRRMQPRALRSAEPGVESRHDGRHRTAPGTPPLPRPLSPAAREKGENSTAPGQTLRVLMLAEALRKFRLASPLSRAVCGGEAGRGGCQPTRPRSLRSAGFTLVEMLVVLMMIGVMAMTVAPALRRPDERGASPSADALAAAMARARLQAVTRAVPVSVDVDLAAGLWAAVAHPADRPVDTTDAGVLPLSSDTRLSGGDGRTAQVAFDGLGRARADRLAVRDAEGTQEIVVDAWTGAARVRPR
jgi:prepilin-type N-terminal cleavage/methylation domain-containing protein